MCFHTVSFKYSSARVSPKPGKVQGHFQYILPFYARGPEQSAAFTVSALMCPQNSVYEQIQRVESLHPNTHIRTAPCRYVLLHADMFLPRKRGEQKSKTAVGRFGGKCFPYGRKFLRKTMSGKKTSGSLS